MRLLLAIPAALLSVAPLAAQAPDSAPGRPAAPTIVTSARGEARVTPDRAIVEVAVQTRAETAAAAASQNARTQRAVLDTLRALGLQNDQIMTAGYHVHPEMHHDEARGPRVIGYQVTNVLRVDVRGMELVGKVMDAALARGANMINSVSFYSSKADSVRRVALRNAVAVARADAEVLAAAAGGRLGDLLEVSTVEPRGPIPFDGGGFAMAEMRSAVPTPIVPGEQTIAAMVVARWRLVGK